VRWPDCTSTSAVKPPVPLTAICSVSPSEVYAGDPVTGTISTQNFNPKHTTYKWNSTGARVSGTGTTGNVDTTGLELGVHGDGHCYRRKGKEEQRRVVQHRLYR
jgi:hypothetical protein